MTKGERAILYLMALCVIGICAAIGTRMADAATVRTGNQGQLALELTRAPAYATGAWTAINPTNVAAASSAALTVGSRYVLQCFDDTYIRFGDAASGQDATSSNGYLPMGAWLDFSVLDSVKYVSVLNKNIDSICYLLEAR